MSLNWNIGNIKDHETVCLKSGCNEVKPVTEVIIWATMAVDLGVITEDNADKFYERLHAWELCSGPFLYPPEGQKGDRFITIEEVKAHIGLKTNVSSTSDTKYRNKLANIMFEKKGLRKFVKYDRR